MQVPALTTSVARRGLTGVALSVKGGAYYLVVRSTGRSSKLGTSFEEPLLLKIVKDCGDCAGS